MKRIGKETRSDTAHALCVRQSNGNLAPAERRCTWIRGAKEVTRLLVALARFATTIYVLIDVFQNSQSLL
jgi:hypothetical protein